MNDCAFKEAYDYMIIAADNYMKLIKTTKNKSLRSTIKSKLIPLLDQIEKCKKKELNFAGEVKSLIVSAKLPDKKGIHLIKSKQSGYKYNPELQGIIEQSILEKSNMVNWDDLIGLDNVKRKIMETIVLPIKNPTLFTGLLTPSKGILLFGPPGNGKTMVAKAIASKCGQEITFFNISASALTSRYFGDSEKLVQTLFSIAAERQPSVIFIDEIDSILGARSSEEQEASRRLKTEFLVQFDGVRTRQEDKVIVIGATNRPFDLDEAVLRRFTSRIFLPLPNEPARAQMIRNKLKTVNNGLTIEEIDEIAKKTEGYSFADLTAVCQEAAMEPIRSLDYERLIKIKKEDLSNVTIQDFYSAIIKVTKTVSQQTIINYQKWVLNK
jgi:spastin